MLALVAWRAGRAVLRGDGDIVSVIRERQILDDLTNIEGADDFGSDFTRYLTEPLLNEMARLQLRALCSNHPEDGSPFDQVAL
jgi:hypothetical protein